jgi:hypothetical protein
MGRYTGLCFDRNRRDKRRSAGEIGLTTRSIDAWRLLFVAEPIGVWSAFKAQSPDSPRAPLSFPIQLKWVGWAVAQCREQRRVRELLAARLSVR